MWEHGYLGEQICHFTPKNSKKCEACKIKEGSKVAVCRIIFVVSNSVVTRDYGLNLFTKSKNSISCSLSAGLTSGKHSLVCNDIKSSSWFINLQISNNFIQFMDILQQAVNCKKDATYTCTTSDFAILKRYPIPRHKKVIWSYYGHHWCPRGNLSLINSLTTSDETS